MIEARSSSDPETRAVARIEREQLYRAMRELPEEQRVAITLVGLSGFSTYEAAEVMGRTAAPSCPDCTGRQSTTVSTPRRVVNDISRMFVSG